jgi:signal transduction histidine kinase
VSLTVRQGRDPDGQPQLRWVLADAAAHEIARAELANRLEQTRAEAAHSHDVATWQSTLLGASAHDLRTPLGVISGTVETLLEHWDEIDAERARELLEGAQAQTSRLRRVLAGLLDMSQLQLESDHTHREPVPLRTLVEETLAMLPFSGHEIMIHIDGAMVAMLDPAQVERIVTNLVTNAARHAPDGTGIRVAAAATPHDATAVLLVVEDEGPGVPDDVRELIFEPFVHLDTEGARSGLGLAIVAMFAAFHGGRAWVEDRTGGGASFRVLLQDALPAPAGVHPAA